jgi:serine protease Do
MRYFMVLVVVVVLLTVPFSAKSAVIQSQVEVVKKVMPAIVGIGIDKRSLVSYRFGGSDFFEEFKKQYQQEDKRFKEKGKPQWNKEKEKAILEDIQIIGSGFIIEKDGKVITNAHVVEGQKHVFVTTKDGNIYKAEVWRRSIETDLAILQIEDAKQDFPVIAMGDSDKIDIAEPVIAIGNPFGLSFTVTGGIVSALHRAASIDDLIQTDAAINHGNSGGPLINAAGEVIGVNQSLLDPSSGGRTGINIGIGFAVPINKAKALLASVPKAGGMGYLGVEVAMVQERITVARVEPDSPADKAGMREGDMIVAMGGTKTNTIQDFVRYVRQKKVGEKISLTLVRKGVTKNIEVILGEKGA